MFSLEFCLSMFAERCERSWADLDKAVCDIEALVGLGQF